MNGENKDTWWIDRRDELLGIADKHLNAYVYDLQTIRKAVAGMRALESVDRILYAVKANYNADVLRTIAAAGADFDCVSRGEIEHLQQSVPDLEPGRILFTPNFAPRSEYEWAIEQKVQITLDSVYPLQHWPDLLDGQDILVRLDPGKGKGHHAKVKTAGNQSKFGVNRDDMKALAVLADNSNVRVTGIHAHAGSGILKPTNWKKVADILVSVAEIFPEVRVLDLGGGFGVPRSRHDPAFDIATLNETLLSFRREHPGYSVWLEPGRFLVAQSGVLLTHVTQTKSKADHHFIGVSTGFNSFIRPALYDAYHEIVNLTRIDEDHSKTVSVVGPICETGDSFGSEHQLPECAEGDVILLADTGAYGYVMSSRYNLRDVAPELAI